MSTQIDDLRRNLVRYGEYLLHQLPAVQLYYQQELPVNTDFDYMRIPQRNFTQVTDSLIMMAAAILRVNEALAAAELYEPVRVDTLLVLEDEKGI